METSEVFGKYVIQRPLGRGAMGIVYEGWDPVIARRVAIKTIRLSDGTNHEAEQTLARFRREAQAAGRLVHPNIVAVFDYGETNDLAYIVMEYVDGPTLKTLLDKQERFALADTLRIMDHLLAGLQFSHEHGVVHRDIKPANVMLTSSGQAKITDFGIARIENSSMTQAGTVLGTPAYMSPEQFMGQVVDARTDIYSSGLLLYQLLTGERPFEGSMSAIMHKALNTELPPPSVLSVQAPPAFDAVVRRATAKRPEDRYATAAALATAIRIAADHPGSIGDTDTTIVSATRQAALSLVPSAAKAVSRSIPAQQDAIRPTLSMIIVAACVSLVLASGGIWWLLQRSPSDQTISGSKALPATTVPPIATAAEAGPRGLTAVTTSRPIPVPVPPSSVSATASQSPIPQFARPDIPQPPPQVTTSSTFPPSPGPTVAAEPSRSVTQPQLGLAQAGDEATRLTTAFPSVQPDTVSIGVSSTSLPPEQPQREALLARPPTAAPKPITSPEASSSRLELARASARSLLCSVLNVAGGTDGLRVSGLALAGLELDRFLAELRNVGRVDDEITRVDPFACAPMATANAFVRRTWDSTPPAFAIRLERQVVANGARLGIDLTTALPVHYVDLYQGDGSVRHLLRPTPSNSASKPRAEWVATPPAGPRLIIALGVAAPLDFGLRPETERATDYLAALQASLQRATEPPAADLAIVTVHAAESTVVKVPQLRPATLRSDRCANIIGRAQLGETLSDAELAALRTECRS
jgi:serine/threonine-protein kinase